MFVLVFAAAESKSSDVLFCLVVISLSEDALLLVGLRTRQTFETNEELVMETRESRSERTRSLGLPSVLFVAQQQLQPGDDEQAPPPGLPLLREAENVIY